MGDRHGVAIMLRYGTDPTTTPGALIRRPNCQNLSPIPGAQLGWRARGDGGSPRERQRDTNRSRIVPSTCLTRELLVVPHGQSRPTETAAHHLCPGRVMLFPSSQSHTDASGSPRLRDGPRLVPKVVSHQLRGYPATSAAKDSKARPPTRRDTRLRTLMSCDRTPHLARPAILSRAPRVPVPTGTHGEPRTLTVRVSLTVHQSTFLLTDSYGPHLCKAVLGTIWRGVNGTGIRPRSGRLQAAKRWADVRSLENY